MSIHLFSWAYRKDHHSCPVCRRSVMVVSGVFLSHGPGPKGAWTCPGTGARLGVQ